MYTIFLKSRLQQFFSTIEGSKVLNWDHLYTNHYSQSENLIYILYFFSLYISNVGDEFYSWDFSISVSAARPMNVYCYGQKRFIFYLLQSCSVYLL